MMIDDDANCQTDSWWMTYQLECSKIAKIWGFVSHSTNRWKYTQVCGMRMTGPQEVDLRKQIGPRLLSLLHTKASILMAVKPLFRPSTVLHRGNAGGIRKSFRILMLFSTEGSNGFAVSSPFTITVLIVLDSQFFLLNAEETETYEDQRSYDHII